MRVPLVAARAARDALWKEHWAALRSLGYKEPELYTGEHEDVDPGAWIISWEEGPEEWVYDAEMRDYVNAAFKAALKRVHPQIDGHIEPINRWCMGLYAYSTSTSTSDDDDNYED